MGGRGQYGDPIGEDACWPDEIDDVIDRKVRAMVRKIVQVLNTASWMAEQSARRTVEVEREEYLRTTCQACRTGGNPRLILGYCRGCYNRWNYLARPNRITFEKQRRTELGIDEIQTTDSEVEKTRAGLSEEIQTPPGIMEWGGERLNSLSKGPPDQIPPPSVRPSPAEGDNEQVRRAQSIEGTSWINHPWNFRLKAEPSKSPSHGPGCCAPSLRSPRLKDRPLGPVRHLRPLKDAQ